MRTPVFELHIRPMFRRTDLAHMRVQIDLSDYNQIVDNADRLLLHLRGERDHALMPPLLSGGPWPDEWVWLFQRWMETGFKRLELGTAQYSFDAKANLILAMGTFPAAGYNGWLQIESETEATRTYVLYFEPPDAAVTGNARTFSLEESYEGPETQSVDVLDSTGVHHLR
jgi:hypothetical protein